MKKKNLVERKTPSNNVSMVIQMDSKKVEKMVKTIVSKNQSLFDRLKDA